MTLFWIASIILVVFSCVLIALPVMRQKANNDEALRDELNKAFY
ncbi:c-type cytochrome biogenesis protein CcmI, partial [Vibrio sinaloensis]